MLTMDEGLWSKLNRVNSSVNKDKRPMSDLKRFNKIDWWTSSGNDCEDYALEKAKRLETLGLKHTDMRMAVCQIPNRASDSELHALLLVETDLGAYALDLFFDDVKPWRSLVDNHGYTFIQVSDPNDPEGRWREVA